MIKRRLLLDFYLESAMNFQAFPDGAALGERDCMLGFTLLISVERFL